MLASSMQADINAFAAMPGLMNTWGPIEQAIYTANHTQHSSSSITFVAGTLQAGSAYARLQLQGGRTIKAKLVVGSDGGNSKVRQMAQLRTVSWSYKQRGLVATVATDSTNTSALQVFLPNGPLALLPVRDGFSNIVWSTTPAQAAELEAMQPDAFVHEVNMVS